MTLAWGTATLTAEVLVEGVIEVVPASLARRCCGSSKGVLRSTAESLAAVATTFLSLGGAGDFFFLPTPLPVKEVMEVEVVAVLLMSWFVSSSMSPNDCDKPDTESKSSRNTSSYEKSSESIDFMNSSTDVSFFVAVCSFRAAGVSRAGARGVGTGAGAGEGSRLRTSSLLPCAASFSSLLLTSVAGSGATGTLRELSGLGTIPSPVISVSEVATSLSTDTSGVSLNRVLKMLSSFWEVTGMDKSSGMGFFSFDSSSTLLCMTRLS
mmetsp:Transcript_21747/g.23722  ORF Transcript_21747/g.23722 Transcript_21747/m.23722 type:complete len:266 (+) Transcript_21747:2180-2977(+)